VSLLPSGNPKYRVVAYAATVAGRAASDLTVEAIGRQLGEIAKERGHRKISTPVLGAGSGQLPAPIAAAALARGFQSTAPESAELWISIRDRPKFNAVMTRLLGLIPHDLPVDDSMPPTSANVLLAAATPVPKVGGRSSHEVPYEVMRQFVERQVARSDRPAHSTPAAAPSEARSGVFISYSHADAWWLERLQKHLKPLQREGVEVWDDTRLKAGEQWREEIRQALATTKVAILLISADFMASDFIDKNELPPLLQAAEEDGATVLPVIINHCRFVRTPGLSRFQPVNDPAKPLAQMSPANREKVLDSVARAVEDALKK
jgi:hypothetical protein